MTKKATFDPEALEAGMAADVAPDNLELLHVDQLDPLGIREEQKHMSNVWRSWSEHAAPELRKEFESRTRGVVAGVRAQYHGAIDPRSGEYRNLRRDCIEALNRLSEAVQAEHDANDQDQ